MVQYTGSCLTTIRKTTRTIAAQWFWWGFILNSKTPWTIATNYSKIATKLP